MEQWIIIVRLSRRATLDGLQRFLEAFYEEAHGEGSPMATIRVSYVDSIGEVIMYDPDPDWNLREAYEKICELAEEPLEGSGIYAKRGTFLNGVQ